MDHGRRRTFGVASRALAALFIAGGVSVATGTQASAGVATVALGNLVWLDSDADGQFEPGEVEIAGVVVNLRATSGSTIASTTTDAAGRYVFSGLEAGDYIVEAIPPLGFESSPGSPDPNDNVDNDDNGAAVGAVIRSGPVTLTVGGEPVNDGDTDANTNLTVDFGLVRTAPPTTSSTTTTNAPPADLRIGDLVFFDANGDGVPNAGEVGAAGVAVQLTGDTDADGNDDVSESTVTGADGSYLFDGLGAGVYSIAITPPPGYPDGGPLQVTLVDSDRLDIDFGLFLVGASTTTTMATTTTTIVPSGQLVIGDRVFLDADGDGVQAASEPGVPAAIVTLAADFDGDGNADVVGDTGTDATGAYAFTSLSPGFYTVSVVPPPGLATPPARFVELVDADRLDVDFGLTLGPATTSTTTTTAPTSSSVAVSTTSTASSSTTPGPTTTGPAATLPETGASSAGTGWTLLLGAVLVGTGISLVARRKV